MVYIKIIIMTYFILFFNNFRLFNTIINYSYILSILIVINIKI